ncbi:hypothetical protein KR018_003724, partial [Drosophila ironensis]
QQSVLREMMLQDLQREINSLPKLENHNRGGYDFSMILDNPPKAHWMYSSQLRKLYIRMNKTFNMDVQFKVNMPIQPLNLRVFLCFAKDVSGPVLRCQNHLSVEPLTGSNSTMRESLLRCENPSTIYCGSAEGKGIAERYSVVVPLNQARSSTRGGGYVVQPLVFKFVCQNSCFGRKETCMVFCLENASGEILGQQVLDIKICTCPKRDRMLDERQKKGKKRKSRTGDDEPEEDESEVKPAKMPKSSEPVRDIKEETESNDSNDSEVGIMPEDWQVSRTEEGEYRMVLVCPNKDWLLRGIEGMIKEAAADVLRCQTNAPLRRYANRLLSLK